MKILQLTTDFGKGGAERVFSQLSIELAKNHEVLECVFNKDIERIYPSKNVLFDLNSPKGHTIFSKFYAFIQRILKVKRIKKTEQVDICISHLEGADYINILSRHKEKIILCVHGSKKHDQDISGIIGYLRIKFLIPILYKKADHIVVVSKGIKEELINHFSIKEEKISVIENFFEINKIENLANEKLSPSEESFFLKNHVLISSGRFANQKNHLFLLQLFSKILKRWPHLKLVLLGDGPLKSELIKLAEELRFNYEFKISSNQSANLYLLGYKNNPFNYINRAKIFLLPSLWEGFPLVLCESMIVQTPVVAYDCPTGPREILLSKFHSRNIDRLTFTEFGVLVPFRNDHNDWIKGLDRLLNDENLYKDIKIAARNRMSAYDKPIIIQKWMDLINAYKP